MIECTHPARRGRHEEYIRPDGSRFCRACGRELDPPRVVAGIPRSVIAPEIAAARLRHVIARLPLWEAGECSKYADLIEWQANRIRELEART